MITQHVESDRNRKEGGTDERNEKDGVESAKELLAPAAGEDVARVVDTVALGVIALETANLPVGP
jgi:hypothetical protein